MGMNLDKIAEKMYEMAMSHAKDTGDDLIESREAWGFESTIVAEGDAWLLYVEGVLMTAASAEDPITAMDTLYNRVIELFVSQVVLA